MIQELLEGGGEGKISINGGLVEGSSSSTSSSSDQQNLRCPRCDSANTKFCYYNNYNLTQPRHFCKTCRRYWTKGGALRNIPIGGGCRKSKSASISPANAKSNAGKSKLASSDIGKSNLGSGFDHELPPSNPILWGPPQNNSQLLALLRATQNPNPNSAIIKDEGVMIGPLHMGSDSAVVTGALNGGSLSFDHLTQSPIGLSSSYWRNSQHHQQPLLHQQPQQNSILLGEVQNSGIQDLYRRFRSSANYYTDHSQAVLSNAVSSSNSSILEPTPITGGEFGYWNSPFSWSDLSTTNGAFP
ncbi:uncharacterized protein LOC143858052 [Tasmannia lanceolata]|uniref:uncharacterized protein LOC143858052 n=1 Tax=Tasmannia lanceolata TaxID=3420 RepID=UPI004064A778